MKVAVGWLLLAGCETGGTLTVPCTTCGPTGSTADTGAPAGTGDTAEPAPTGDTGAPPPTADTAPPTVFVYTAFGGDVIVDVAARTWLGVETWTATDVGDGSTLCAFAWDTRDWASDPETSGPPPHDAAACADPDGTPCTFALTATSRDGRQTAGSYSCAELGFPEGDHAGATGWGFHADYRVSGVGFGAQLMYAYGVDLWVAATRAPYLGGSAALDTGTGAFVWSDAFAEQFVLP